MHFEKIKDIIWAGAIGDAFGYYVEFDDWNTIKSKYGPQGIQLRHIEENESAVSDDTQMTFFCWDAIIPAIQNSNEKKEIIIQNIYLSFLDWNRTQWISEMSPKTDLGQFADLWQRQAPGHTCLSALGSYIRGSLDKKLNNSKGCGAIMRTAPIAFLDLPLIDIFDLGMQQAAITHGHKEGYLSSGFFSGLLKELIEGKDFNQASSNNMNILKQQKDNTEMVEYLEQVINELNHPQLLVHDKLEQTLGGGWVGEQALGIAIYASQKGKNLEEVLDISTNHGGDSDSTASLAAQLYIANHDLSDYFKHQIKLDISAPFNYLLNKTEKAISLKEEKK